MKKQWAIWHLFNVYTVVKQLNTFVHSIYYSAENEILTREIGFMCIPYSYLMELK